MTPEARLTDPEHEITITRIVEAPPAAVFEAWIEPSHLARWWGPRSGRIDWSTPHVETKPQPGGAYRICIRSPRGDDHWARGIYEAVDAPRRLVFTHAWESEPGPVGEEPRVSVDFTGLDARTCVRFRKSGFASRASRDGEVEGWHECLDRLVRYFVDGRAAPQVEDEAEIRALASAWSEALEAKDIDGLTDGYAPDALLFDVKPPYAVRGPKAIRAIWEACLPCLPARFGAERRELEVTAGGDVAFAHFLHRIRPIGETSRAGDTWVRATVCYQRIDGRWRVAHEHVSLPFDPASDRVVFVTDADLATGAS